MTAQFPPPLGSHLAASGPAQRIAALLADRPRALQIDHLCDTRPLHRLLARLSTARRPPAGAGRYRGPGETVCVRVRFGGGPVMTSRTCPPDRVAMEMHLLSARLHALLSDPPVPASRHDALAGVLAAFFRIHPYQDGNGRIARILFHRAAALLDLPLNDRWTLDRRGYGSGLGLAVESFPVSPKPLETYLKRFFR